MRQKEQEPEAARTGSRGHDERDKRHACRRAPVHDPTPRGRSQNDIRGFVEKHIVTRNDGIKDLYAKKASLRKWLTGVRLAMTRTGLLKADSFLRYLIKPMDVTRFEDREIPLRVVATDFYSGESIVFDSGPLLPALKASMSIPGVFVPVEHEGRILVDGGVSNNLPYDVLPEQCDLTIAVDVSPTRKAGNADPPGMVDATLGLFDMLVEQVTKAMLVLVLVLLVPVLMQRVCLGQE